jgi:hypothetical protein
MERFRWVEVPEGYRCPFCPSHADEDFYIWDLILEQPICDGCTYDLYYALLEAHLKNSVLTDLFPKLEELTGKPAVESALTLVLDEIAYMEKEENLQAKIADPREYPTPTRQEIELKWQEDLDYLRSTLAELTKLVEER